MESLTVDFNQFFSEIAKSLFLEGRVDPNFPRS